VKKEWSLGHSFFTFWQVIAVSAEYDLLIKHGSLLDTASGYNQSTQDIGISDGRIHAIRDEIYEEDAETVVDASSTINLPWTDRPSRPCLGRGRPSGRPCGPELRSKGVTTAFDAGSAGADTYPGFRNT
jgi:dihydroorotase